MNVHAKSHLILEPLRTLRSEDKGQAGACLDRTRAIPCTVRAVTGQLPGTASCDGRQFGLGDSNGDSNSNDQPQTTAIGNTATRSLDS